MSAAGWRQAQKEKAHLAGPEVVQGNRGGLGDEGNSGDDGRCSEVRPTGLACRSDTECVGK